MGRHTEYTAELGREICETIATNGSGLATLCKANPHWPHRDTIYTWLRTQKDFADLYTQAKREQVTALVDDILEISDDSSRDVLIKQDKDGNDYEVFNAEFAARSRLRVDTRKWLAAKLVPRLYGENMLARELADEMEDFKKELENQKLRNKDNGKAHSSKTKENTQE